VKKIIGLYDISKYSSKEIYEDVMKNITPAKEPEPKEKEWEIAFIPAHKPKNNP